MTRYSLSSESFDRIISLSYFSCSFPVSLDVHKSVRKNLNTIYEEPRLFGIKLSIFYEQNINLFFSHCSNIRNYINMNQEDV